MPDIFETADIHVALGGDTMNTVPRYGVTAGEIALLQVIHGNDAVHNIEPTGTIARSQRVERERLKLQYAGARANDGRPHVEIMYPGAAARIFERLDELVLEDTQFAREPVARANVIAPAALKAEQDAAGEAVNESVANVSKKRGRKAKAKAAAPARPQAAAPPVDTGDDADDLDELPADDGTLGALE